jgi:hypothetical protein
MSARTPKIENVKKDMVKLLKNYQEAVQCMQKKCAKEEKEIAQVREKLLKASKLDMKAYQSSATYAKKNEKKYTKFMAELKKTKEYAQRKKCAEKKCKKLGDASKQIKEIKSKLETMKKKK